MPVNFNCWQFFSQPNPNRVAKHLTWIIEVCAWTVLSRMGQRQDPNRLQIKSIDHQIWRQVPGCLPLRVFLM